MIRSVAVLALALALAPAASAAKRPAPDANVVPGQYVVVYKGSAASVGTKTDEREAKLGFKSKFRYRHALKGFAGKLSPGQVRALEDDPEVDYVVPDRRVHATSQVPIAPGDSAPTGTRRIAAATATTAGSASGVGVAVVDTGVDLTHPDLNVSDGTNCISPGTPADDGQGHGTHVAGSIAAKNDGTGVVGVVPGTNVWAVKVLDSEGGGSLASVACGLDWVAANAAAKNIKVLNMSLGGSGAPVKSCASTTDPLHQAVCRVTAAGVLNVVAAGNEAWDFDYELNPDVPAAYPEALTVTALSDSDGVGGGAGGAPACRAGEQDDIQATFSSFAATPAGENHTIAAPGICIRSTWPTDVAPSGGYNTISGTSMASPHMAGVAALCENDGGAPGACAGKTPAEVISSLRSAAQSYTTANPSYGFTHDPAHAPLAAQYYGYLTRAVDAGPDTLAPDTSITSGPSGTTTSSSASFSFSASEAGSSFECKLDSGAWVACSSPTSLMGLSDGSHTFSVRATDAAGNTDASEATRTWTVNTAAPPTPIQPTPSQPTPLQPTPLQPMPFPPMPSSGVTTPTTDQIGAALRSDLAVVARDLRRLGIAKLVRRRGFTARGLDALLAGRFSATLTGTPLGAAVARSVVLAKGSRAASGAGGYAFEVKLTRQGRRLLRSDRRAKVTLGIAFRETSGPAITERKSFGMRR